VVEKGELSTALYFIRTGATDAPVVRSREIANNLHGKNQNFMVLMTNFSGKLGL
jgi:hypothetical protein